ncbi:MAG: WxcM-like domain-containing protein [Myxococcales bacterium]|mgnify:CR=1 FL=1|jgi:dTDP-4-dehydrorhamnose 3,5-epimerase-like enzyme|nr:WxcM-like domain-containing protein [Myxococcales bacterium]
MNQKMIKLKCHVNDKGSLISLESGKNIPFDIKRVYYIFGVKDEVRRGFHAHKSLDQVLVCTSGSCKVLTDDGRNKENYELNSPVLGLHIGAMLWHEMFDFSQDCVLMVLASDFYDESDYVRDYSEFIAKIKKT